jgi:hypothetical protein
VRVKAVAPGPIETDMLSRFAGSDERKASFAAGVPLKRLGRAEEIAEAVVFLASRQGVLHQRIIRSRQWRQSRPLTPTPYIMSTKIAYPDLTQRPPRSISKGADAAASVVKAIEGAGGKAIAIQPGLVRKRHSQRQISGRGLP